MKINEALTAESMGESKERYRIYLNGKCVGTAYKSGLGWMVGKTDGTFYGTRSFKTLKHAALSLA